MLRQILMGGSISVCNVVIHALFMTAVVRSSQATAVKAASRPNLLLIAVMVATVSVLMAAHVCEVIVWSLAYGLVDAAPADTDFLYFAFVNYTTLGYGDVVPVERWRLLGPMTAMNGMLLFGWSTAVIFEVLWKAMADTRLRRSEPFEIPLVPKLVPDIREPAAIQGIAALHRLPLARPTPGRNRCRS
jgi:hypothetical protein